jgi:hypothetical protein
MWNNSGAAHGYAEHSPTRADVVTTGASAAALLFQAYGAFQLDRRLSIQSGVCIHRLLGLIRVHIIIEHAFKRRATC